MARKLTDQQKIDIVHKYTIELRSCRSLAKEYGVTDHNVLQILRYRGVKTRGQKNDKENS